MSTNVPSALIKSYGDYKEIMDSINCGRGCSPKDYGQYLQNKKCSGKTTAKPLKRGMRK